MSWDVESIWSDSPLYDSLTRAERIENVYDRYGGGYADRLKKVRGRAPHTLCKTRAGVEHLQTGCEVPKARGRKKLKRAPGGRGP